MNFLNLSARVLANKWAERLALIILGLFFLAWIIFYPVSGVLNALVFPEVLTTDGPFQLLNALRRIAAGMEFQFFHGKGIAWLHYPLYALFGQSLNSLQLTRSFTTLILFVIGTALIARIALRQQRTRWLLIAILIVFALFSPWSRSLMIGGNSSVGVRSFMPLVVFALLYLPFSWRKALLVGAALGAALAISTEQGIAITVSYVGCSVFYLLLKRRAFKQNVLFLLLSLVTLGLSFIILMVVMSGGWEQALRTIRYNFVEVTADQIWYFGVPPQNFVHTLDNFANQSLVMVSTLGYVFIVVYAFGSLREKSTPFERSPAFAGLVFLLYGLIAMSSWIFSYTSAHLLQPTLRSIVICAALLLLHRFDTPLIDMSAGQRQRRLLTVGITIILSFIFFIGRENALTPLLDDLIIGIWNERNVSASLSPYWLNYQQATTSALESVSTTEPPVIWGVYSGFLHDHYDIFNPVEEDYIIHALGEARRANYVARFSATQPQFIEIPRADQFNFYEWMVNESWQFFELVYINYRPLVETGHSWIMARTDAAWQSPPSACEAYPVQGDSFALPDRYLESAFPRMLTATIQYQTENPYGRIPLVGGLPRYFVFVEHGYYFGVSLPPRAETFTFPVLLTTPEPTRVNFTARSLTPNAALHVEQICLRETFIPPENVVLMIGLVDGEVEED